MEVSAIKCFSLNSQHDVEIRNGVIQLTEGAELTRQTAETTVNTKMGEWFLNDELGVDFTALLGKDALKNEDAIRNAILEGLQQVDSTFQIDTFDMEYNNKIRKLTVKLTASTESGRTIELSEVWG